MKTITLKNYEIATIVNTLNNPTSIINSTDQSKTYPVSLLWKINSNKKILDEIMERIGAEEQKINAEYSTDDRSIKNEDGTIQVKEEFRKEYMDRKTELFDISNEIQIQTIQLSELDRFNFVPADFKSIEFMVVAEEVPAI